MTVRRPHAALPTLLPALLLPLVLLAGCDGGSSDRVSAGASEGASSPGSSASEPDVPSASAPSFVGGGGGPANPCDVVDQDEVAALMGLKHIEGDPAGGFTSTETCSFFDTEHLDAPLLTLQTSATDDYDQFLALSKNGMGEPEPIDVPGADEAAVLVDDDPEFPGATVVAHTPGLLQVAVVGDKSVEAARRLGIDAVTLLVASSS